MEAVTCAPPTKGERAANTESLPCFLSRCLEAFIIIMLHSVSVFLPRFAATIVCAECLVQRRALAIKFDSASFP